VEIPGGDLNYNSQSLIGWAEGSIVLALLALGCHWLIVVVGS